MDISKIYKVAHEYREEYNNVIIYIADVKWWSTATMFYL